MSTKRYTVTCHWDEEAEVWYVAETDVPGLATESATVEEMEDKLLWMVPEVLALNGAPSPSEPVLRIECRPNGDLWKNIRTTAV